MKELSKDELIFHLIRVGAKGDSLNATTIQLIVLTQIRRFKNSGRLEEAENLLRALMESGYNPLDGVLR